MSTSFRITTVAITSTFVMALAAGCGHSARFEDAFEKSKGQPSTGSGGTGNTPSTGGMGATGGSTSGSGGMAPGDQCADAPTQELPDGSMKAYVQDPKVLAEVEDLIQSMDLSERISQMLGVDTQPNSHDYYDIERIPDVTLKSSGKLIRGYNYRDAGHGVNLDAGQYNSPHGARASDGNDFSTVFPAVSLRAASWDVDLERRCGEAMGDETAASMNNMLLAPCMNIIRHPYWGRTQETYGEDSYHVGRMATAFTVGLQRYVTGCAKHFAANNVEQFRAKQDALMEDEQTLREIYGRHFEMVIRDGGVGCIMASYNLINGVKSTQNHKLLTDILRKPVDQGGMNYNGLVLSDWWAMPGDQGPIDGSVAKGDAKGAVEAGLDIEVPWTLHYSQSTLQTLVSEGLDQKLIENAARHVLEQKVRFNTAYDTSPWGKEQPTSKLVSGGASIETNETHENLAEETAMKSMVLVKNGDTTPVLPLQNPATVGVVGLTVPFYLISTTPPKSGTTFNFAETPSVGDRGSSRVNCDPARGIGATKGLQMTAPTGTTVTPFSGGDVATTMAAVTAADPSVLVVVVGYTPGDEGEEYAINAGGDRASLHLPGESEALVTAALDKNKPTVIVMYSGSVVAMPWLSHANKNQATVWAGYPGVRGGTALGKLLFGAANFSGKMALAWPADDSQLQTFKNDGPNGTGTKMSYFFGYRRYDQLGMNSQLAFEYGHGLSYSTFKYENVTVPCVGEVTNNAIVNITVDITNTAGPAGDEIAFLFIKPPPKPAGITGQRPVKELKSFARVSLGMGEKKTVTLPLRIQDLRRWEGGENGHWTIDPGDYGIMVGTSGADADLAKLPMATLKVKGG